jgi:hypothetical protein
MCLWVSYKKKTIHFFASLKSLKKVSDLELDLDPLVRDTDPHQNFMDPQNCLQAPFGCDPCRNLTSYIDSVGSGSYPQSGPS